jgi:hypothetical protein
LAAVVTELAGPHQAGTQGQPVGRTLGQGPAARAGDETKLPFDTYSGYFVSNQFQPNAPESIVVIGDQEQFDRVFGVAFVMAAMAGCGLPGFLNFVGEVSVFFGAWSQPTLRVVTVLAVRVVLSLKLNVPP